MTPIESIPVLDHGYIRLIESWGSDERIIEAARMSTNKGFQGWGPKCKNCEMVFSNGQTPENDPYCTDSTSHEITAGDEKLLAYLYNHKHATPFEMAGLIIEVQAPIFVFREWHRHRTQSYNEMSARYTPLPDLNYLPSEERLLQDGGKNKQATSTGAILDSDGADRFRACLIRSYDESQRLYTDALQRGVPKELARLVLPVARYSKMRASANLRNWLAFLTLRMDKSAQFEIRQYANVIGSLISQLFPRTWALFVGERGE